MRPPECAVCDSRDNFSDALGEHLLKFANYEPLPHGMTGHPKGVLWVCSEHLPAMQALTALSSLEAVQQVRS